MIYFDNAATTFPKPRNVLKGTFECMSKYCGNSGRGSHKLSIMTSEKIYETRERIANLLGISHAENVVFTQNATHALNLAIKTTVKPDTHVVISDMEHNSVLRPVHALSKNIGVKYSVFSTYGNIEENIEKCINNNTRCVISSLASNVIGREVPMDILTKVCEKNKLSLITDASQVIGHKEINLSNTPCSVLCAPGHKALFGIQGSGFAVFSDDEMRDTFIEGGSGSESLNLNMPEYLPERFEAGTLSSPSIISLGEGIKFIEKVGLKEIEEKLTRLTERCAAMISNIKNSVLYEYGNGVISFNLNSVPAETVSQELDKYGIYTRSGFHCAPMAHKLIGTGRIGTVRISFSYLNKLQELDEFYKVIKTVSRKYS